MAKMNIYVPDDLKRRMDGAEGVNWSPLACKAFEAKLAEIIAKKGPKDMEDVIARLKASKDRSSSESEREGHAAGAKWARTSAEAVELERLSDLADEPSWGIQGLFAGGNHFSPAERFALTIKGASELEHNDVRGFWYQVNDGRMPHDNDFIEGFAEGALEVWDAVKDQL